MLLLCGIFLYLDLCTLGVCLLEATNDVVGACGTKNRGLFLRIKHIRSHLMIFGCDMIYPELADTAGFLSFRLFIVLRLFMLALLTGTQGMVKTWPNNLKS